MVNPIALDAVNGWIIKQVTMRCVMDTSKEYQKMCENAVEVQDGWKLEGKDFWVKREIRIDVKRIEDMNIWLPRQDQLQGMMKDLPHNMISGLWEWMQNRMEKENIESDSMEQLWLAFVMKERFGKQWTGTDWEVCDG